MQLAPERQEGKEAATQQRSKAPALQNLQLKRALNGIEGFEAQSAALVPPASGPGAAVQLKTATGGPDLAAVQDKLNQLGYPCGKADGIMGPKTRSAIMS